MKTKPSRRDSQATVSARRSPPHAPGSSLQIKSILVPIDFSAPSKKALAYAAAFAEQFGAKLTLLHVLEPVGTHDFSKSFPLMMDTDKVLAESRTNLERLVRENEIQPELVQKVLVRQGRAFHEIGLAAEELK